MRGLAGLALVVLVGVAPPTASATIWEGSTDAVTNPEISPGQDIVRFELVYDDVAGSLSSALTFRGAPSVADDALVAATATTPACSTPGDLPARIGIGGSLADPGSPVIWTLTSDAGDLLADGDGARSLAGPTLTLSATDPALAGQTVRCAAAGLAPFDAPDEPIDQTDRVVLTPRQSPPPPPEDTEVALRIKGKKRLRVNGRRVARLELACPASEASPPCRGNLRLKTRKRVRFRGKRRKVTFAKARFRVGAGGTERVKLRLSRKKARLVRKRRKARRARAIARVRDGAGNRDRVDKMLGLRPR